MHSAFTFGQESFISRSDIQPAAVPPGLLITLLQKGLQYTSVEHHLNEDGSEKECGRAWSLLEPHVCEPPKPRAKAGRGAWGAGDIINIEDAMPGGVEAAKPGKKRKKEGGGAGGKPRAKSTIDVVGDDEQMPAAGPMVERFLESEVVTLTGHRSEVISCAWNPCAALGLLASVAGDDTGRIWPLDPAQRLDAERIVGHERVLHHRHGEGQSKEVTTLDWSPDGRFLVTGCYDGRASVWTAAGDLRATFDQFKGPVFALKWSPTGRFIAGAGLEHCAVVWEAAEPAQPYRLFHNHTSPTMDLEWRDDQTFATCTTDKTIYVYSLAGDAVTELTGHADEINSVKWSPDGALLASCSDDATARIYAGTELQCELRGHDKEIYSLKWSPTGATLATASFDNTVRLWDPLTGACTHVLGRHVDSVYAIGFSPDGRFLASGSLDETLNVWSVADGLLVRTYDSGRGGIFDLAWSPTGDRLAACTSDSTVRPSPLCARLLTGL